MEDTEQYEKLEHLKTLLMKILEFDSLLIFFAANRPNALLFFVFILIYSSKKKEFALALLDGFSELDGLA